MSQEFPCSGTVRQKPVDGLGYPRQFHTIPVDNGTTTCGLHDLGYPRRSQWDSETDGRDDFESLQEGQNGSPYGDVERV